MFKGIWTVVVFQVFNFTIIGYKNTNTTITCDMNFYNYPGWSGPPNGTDYSYPKSFEINKKVPRVKWHSNKRDLIITDIQRADAGIYTCMYLNKSMQMTLDVRVSPKPPQIEKANHQGTKMVVWGIEDKQVSLTCISVGGYPAPELHWYDGTHELQSSKTIANQTDNTFLVTITAVLMANRSLDRANYTCQSSFESHDNPLATSIVLYIKLKPSTPRISGSLTVTEYTSTTLQCTTSGCRPEANISWIFNGSTVVREIHSEFNRVNERYTLTSNYSIENLRRVDNGKNISCLVVHEALDSSLVTKEKLNVQFGPETVTLTGDVHLVADGKNKLVLTCVASSANPVSNITWTMNGTYLTTITDDNQNIGEDNGKTREVQVTIIPTHFMDGIPVSCMAEHFLLTQRKQDQIILDLQYQPIVTVESINKTVTEGDDVTLTCLASSKPAATFTWSKTSINDPIVTRNGTSDDNKFVYTIHKVEKTQAGNYSCEAKNGIGNPVYSKVELTVQYPPDVTVTIRNSSSGTEIKCVAQGVPANYSFSSWQQKWPETDEPIRGSLSSTDIVSPSERILRLNEPTYQDSGDYICNVGNGVKQQISNGSVFLLIKASPVLITPLLMLNEVFKVPASLSKEFNFTLTVFSNAGFIKTKLFWLKNSTKLDTNNTAINISNTQIQLLIYEHKISSSGFMVTVSYMIKLAEEFGNYSFDISNDIGTISPTIEIIPLGPPCTPTNVLVHQPMSDSITLSWVRCFHGGLAQTFVIQYSSEHSEWTNISFIKGGLSRDKKGVNATIESLLPNTFYRIRMFAFNAKGRSDYTEIYKVTTRKAANKQMDTLNIGAMGSSVGVVAAVIVIVLVFLLLRRYSAAKGIRGRTLLKGNRRKGMSEQNDNVAASTDEANTMTQSTIYESLNVETIDSTHYEQLSIGTIYRPEREPSDDRIQNTQAVIHKTAKKCKNASTDQAKTKSQSSAYESLNVETIDSTHYDQLSIGTIYRPEREPSDRTQKPQAIIEKSNEQCKNVHRKRSDEVVYNNLKLALDS